MRHKIVLLGTLAALAVMVALAALVPIAHLAVAPEAGNAATVAIATAESPADLSAEPAPDTVLALGIRRCTPTLRHPCRRRPGR